jgi:hypothetical protein
MRRCYGRRISPAYRKAHTCRQHRAAFNGGVTSSRPARRTTGRTRMRGSRLAGLLVVIATTATAAVGHLGPASSSSTAAPPVDLPRGERRGVRGEAPDLRGAPGGAGGEADGALPDGTTVFDEIQVSPTSISAPRCPPPGGNRSRGRRGRVQRRQRAGVPRSTRSTCVRRRSRSTAQKRKPPGGWPRPTRLLTCPGTPSTSGPRRHGMAVRARRRVRAVPYLRQRTLALRAASRGDRSRLPSHVRRPDARPEDAAVTKHKAALRTA